MVTIDRDGNHHVNDGKYTNKPGANASFDLSAARVPNVINVIESSLGKRIELRDDFLEDDSLVLIRMGDNFYEENGNLKTDQLDTFLNRMIDGFGKYKGLVEDDENLVNGFLGISVFGETNGITRNQIFDANNQKKFGSVTWGEIKHLVWLVPDSYRSDDTNETPLDLIQIAHFDLAVRNIDTSLLESGTNLTDEQRDFIKGQLKTAVFRIWKPLEPRKNKEDYYEN